MKQWQIDQAKEQAQNSLNHFFEWLSQAANQDLPDKQRHDALFAASHSIETMHTILFSAHGSIAMIMPAIEDE